MIRGQASDADSDVASERARRARALAAIGEPTRLGIMDLLALEDLSPDALSDALGVPANLLAHHLKVLEDAGLIQRRSSQNDRRRIYAQSVDGGLDGLLPMARTFAATRVVFVCTHNSARSVLADALWRAASSVPSASGGSHPAERINPKALQVARRRGLRIAQTRPRCMADVIRPDDIVVSVCDAVNEHLHDLPNTRLHWSIADPAVAGTAAAFDRAVDELQMRVRHLAPRITPSAPSRRKARP